MRQRTSGGISVSLMKMKPLCSFNFLIMLLVMNEMNYYTLDDVIFIVVGWTVPPKKIRSSPNSRYF